MTSRIIIAGVILVIATVFGVIFWSQFHDSQQNLSGANMPMGQNNYDPKTTTGNSTAGTNPQSAGKPMPDNDNIESISSDLGQINVNSLDSDSSDLNAQINGF
jgi:hypothetical protein